MYPHLIGDQKEIERVEMLGSFRLKTFFGKRGQELIKAQQLPRASAKLYHLTLRWVHEAKELNERFRDIFRNFIDEMVLTSV